MGDPENQYSFLEIFVKDSFESSSGFQLDSQSVELIKQIQAVTSEKSASSGQLYQPMINPGEDKRSGSEISPILARLVKMKLVAHIFEIRHENQNVIFPVSFFLAKPEKNFSLKGIFEIIIQNSTRVFENYILDAATESKDLKIILTNSLFRKIKGKKIDELESILSPDRFKVKPANDILETTKRIIRENIQKNRKIFFHEGDGYIFIPKEGSDNIVRYCLNRFESQVVPGLKKAEPHLQEIISGIEKEQEKYDEEPDNSKTFSFELKKASAIHNYFAGKRGWFGELITDLVLCYISEIENLNISKRKAEQANNISRYVSAMMDPGSDFDSRFLRVNLEDEQGFDFSILPELRRNQEIISAEWNDRNNKISIFAWRDISNLKEINKQIYSKNLKDQTIFHFRVLLESNEKFLSEIFKDQEFIKIYGENLQRLYLRFIPWYYHFFIFLGIKSFTDAGYAQAKSIIKYEQMDREFKYDVRSKEKKTQNKIQRRKNIEAEKETKNLEFLIEALDEFYFVRQYIPICDEIIEAAPALSLHLIAHFIKIKKVIEINKSHPAGTEGGPEQFASILLYPDNIENSRKLSIVKELAEELTKNKGEANQRFILK
ncbi:MAG: hypothetical protein K8R21_10825 [Leptospira sp.]|nr:hypothetical protein [Leptospira sp.]